MLTVLKGTGDWPWLRLCPHVLLTPLLRLAMRAQERNLAPGDMAVRALVPTMHYDALLVREATAAIERLRSLRLPVLLLRGSKSATFLRRGIDVLAQQLPHATQIELAGVGHTAADNDGKPQLVAHALREFFDSAATAA
jgi:pimeloyl-ACP methyl ester carboxylesterase